MAMNRSPILDDQAPLSKDVQALLDDQAPLSKDVQALLGLAECAGAELGAVVDQYGVAALSSEDEVTRTATTHLERALASILARASTGSMRGLSGGFGVMGCWFRVAGSQAETIRLIDGVARIAVANSRRLSLAASGDR